MPLTGAWLWRRLHDATLDDAVMSKAKLSGAVLSDASLKRVNCGQSELTFCVCGDVCLTLPYLFSHDHLRSQISALRQL